MPFCSPRSSSGNTSGRSRLNIRNISAVQRPMPRTSISSAMISSSAICGQRCGWILPSAKCCARSAMYSVLRSDRPQARSIFLSLAITASGVTSCSRQIQKRFHTACAAFTEICCPQMARASVLNGSPRLTMKTFGCARRMAAITGSRRMRARLALSQYSGFIQRQVAQQILRFHVYRALGGATESQINHPATDIRPHRGRLVELEREDGEDVAHPALVDLLARPQLVQDRGRLGVQADVPCPGRLVDLAHGLDLCFDVEEMRNPCLHDVAQRVERGTAVGNADHSVVARFALPIYGCVGAVEHVQVDLGKVALRLDDEPANAAVAVAARMHVDRLQVGEQRVAFLDGCLL